jgi:hypothetical protein
MKTRLFTINKTENCAAVLQSLLAELKLLVKLKKQFFAFKGLYWPSSR